MGGTAQKLLLCSRARQRRAFTAYGRVADHSMYVFGCCACLAKFAFFVLAASVRTAKPRLNRWCVWFSGQDPLSANSACREKECTATPRPVGRGVPDSAAAQRSAVTRLRGG